MMTDEVIDIFNEGYYYYTGSEGYPFDYERAFERFLAAAEQSCGPAMTYLGLMYEDGLGVEENLEQAYAWYRRGMEENDAYSVYNLGRWYLNGIYVEQNTEMAAQYFKRSIEIEPTPQAAYGYGCHCMECNDVQTAARLFEYAAEESDEPEAWHNLGWAIMQGGGGYPKKSKEAAAKALPCYRRAAEQGYVLSMEELGGVIIMVYGIHQGRNEAYRWYKRAADEGSETARDKLKWFRLMDFTDRL